MPAALQVTHWIPGSPPAGSLIWLDKETIVFGRRTEDCHVVFRPDTISKIHAWIVRVGDTYFIEDRVSRNKTYVNGVESPPGTRTRLRHADRIRLGGPGSFEAVFIDSSDNSTVEATLSPSAMALETQPAERLRGLLEISASLSRTLDLDPLLPKIADCLFGLFKQADRCFLIQAEEPAQSGDRPHLRARLVQTRNPKEACAARFSSTIVHRCLESGQALLFSDTMEDFQGIISLGDLRIRSGMCVPLLRPNGPAFGVIQVDTQEHGKKFKKDDLEWLTGVANVASIALENARLHNEAVRQARIDYDLEKAHEVQMSFLPAELPQVAGYEFFAHYQPARAVGGDYYGFLPHPDGRMVVCVGDVAGKGMPAALLVAKFSSEIASCVPVESDPGRMVARLNGLMYPFTSPRHRFVTLALMMLDPHGHRHLLVGAGHPSPLIYRPATGALVPVLSLDDGGLPLGIDRDCTYQTYPLSLQGGEVLLFFSDGVSDALDASGRHFQLQGIQQAVAGLGPTTARGLVEAIVQASSRHAAGCEPFDDVTIVAIQRT